MLAATETMKSLELIDGDGEASFWLLIRDAAAAAAVLMSRLVFDVPDAIFLPSCSAAVDAINALIQEGEKNGGDFETLTVKYASE